MKKWVLILVLIFLLQGCSDSKTGSDASAANVVYKIQRKVSVGQNIAVIPSDEAQKVLGKNNAELLRDYYDLAESDFADYMILTNPVSAKSQEIAVFKYNDENDVDKIKKGIEKRVADKKSESYLPDTVHAVNEATVGVSGKFVYLVIWDEDKEKKTIISTIKDATK